MALVLGVPLGSDFYVGDTRMVVSKITSPANFEVLVEGPQVDRVYPISDFPTEVLADVKLSAGLTHGIPPAGMVKVAIDAPKKVRVLRGDLWREERALLAKGA